MTKIWKKDYYLKLVKSNKKTKVEDLWNRDDQLDYSATQGRSAYNKQYTMIKTMVEIMNYHKENGHLPSVRKLAKILDRGEKSTFDRIKRLQDAGYITKNSKGEITLSDSITL